MDEEISTRDYLEVNGNMVTVLFDTGCRPLSVISKTLAHKLCLLTTPMIKILSTAKKNYKVNVEGRCLVKLKYRNKIKCSTIYS